MVLVDAEEKLDTETLWTMLTDAMMEQYKQRKSNCFQYLPDVPP